MSGDICTMSCKHRSEMKRLDVQVYEVFCCFLSSAPIDDGAVQRLRDLIVSLTLFGLEMECCVTFFCTSSVRCWLFFRVYRFGEQRTKTTQLNPRL